LCIYCLKDKGTPHHRYTYNVTSAERGNISKHHSSQLEILQLLDCLTKTSWKWTVYHLTKPLTQQLIMRTN